MIEKEKINFTIQALKKEYNNFLHLMNIYKNSNINNKKDEQFMIFIIQLLLLIYRKIFVSSSGIYNFLKNFNIYNKEFNLYKLCDSELPDSLKEWLVYEMPFTFNFRSPNIPIIQHVFCKKKHYSIKEFTSQEVFKNLKFERIINKNEKIEEFWISIENFIKIFIDKQIAHLDVNTDTDKNYQKILILQHFSLWWYNPEFLVNILLLELIFPLLNLIPDIILILEKEINNNEK